MPTVSHFGLRAVMLFCLFLILKSKLNVATSPCCFLCTFFVLQVASPLFCLRNFHLVFWGLECQTVDHETRLYFLNYPLSLLATYIWSSVICPHKSWPGMFLCFSSLTSHKGELNVNMHANLISSLCNQLQIIERKRCFSQVWTEFPQIWSTFASGRLEDAREQSTKLWKRRLKEKVGKQRDETELRKRCCWVQERKKSRVGCRGC